MAWVKLDDQFASNPKVLEAGPLGISLQVAALCYCNRHLTDGRLSRPAAATLLSFEGIGMRMWSGEIVGGGEDASWELVADDLVAAGVWHLPGHDCEECPPISSGYYLHAYLDFQPSKAQVEAERKAKSAAGKRGAAKRWDDTTHGSSHGTTHSRTMAEPRDVPCESDANAMAELCPVPVPDPVPERQESTLASATPTPPKRGHRLPDTFRLTDEMRAYAAEKHPTLDVEAQTEQFRDYWRAESGAKATKLDWVAAWRVWLRNAEKWSSRASPRLSKLERNLAAIDNGVAAVNR